MLQHVWVPGPGTASPGELLAGTAAPLSQAEAQALAVDLSQRSTPAVGGFCTFQPVADGGACLWNLDCHTCDKFVLSGADDGLAAAMLALAERTDTVRTARSGRCRLLPKSSPGPACTIPLAVAPRRAGH